MIDATTVTGREILAQDWSRTSLGPVDAWPVSLRALVSLMLASPTPMFLAWGPELLCFFNDAYAPILGYRRDDAMGRPFKRVWASIWGEIEPLVDAALAGRSVSTTDMKLDLSRQGVSEESWWSFTYSPAFDDDGGIAGMICITGETTAKVVAERERDAADERLNLALSAGNSIGAWDWDVVNDLVIADSRFALLYGVDPDLAAKGAPIAAFFSGIHPDDLPRVQKAIGKAMVPGGGPFQAEYRLVGEEGRVRWVGAQGHCIFDDQGRCVRFPGVSFDITDRVKADDALRAAKEEREFIISLSAQQRSLIDADAIMRVTAEQLGKRLETGRVGFYHDVGQTRIRFGPSWTDGSLATLSGDMAADKFGERAAQSRRFGKPVVFADSRNDPEGGMAEIAASGVVAGIGMPVVQNGRLQGGVYVNQASVRAWTAEEIALVKEVAEMTWQAIERAEAVLRLHSRIERQQSVLEDTTRNLRDQSAGRAEAETQVRQLQKMEAVGQLTGGIAHDFNNMLAVVIGGLNLAQRRLARGDTDIDRYIDSAMDGATRAATLTQRLLAFSRQQPLSPEAIDANKLVSGLTELLTRTLGDAMHLETVLGAGLWKAKADPNQLENAIVNLAVNARDAMADGGKLTVETANVHVDRDYAADAEMKPGQYVLLAVTDNGSGMPPDVLAKAFDPFFTTKGVGKGTGLGLSQVFGFVRQSGGNVRIYSEVGRGTTVKLYLPRFYGEETAAAPRRKAQAVQGGHPHEIILVVEDEERVRHYSVEALRELGYTVIHAADGAQALTLIEGGQDVTLLFTDIVMPGMSGRQLADRAKEKLPRLRVIYTTGYTRNAVVHDGTLDPGTHFLPKPFGIEPLAQIVREVLDEAVST